jgi:GNAT superfamily N-acetyltransferase
MYIPILWEIDCGERFLLSMLYWCGIGSRSTPLDYWQVFLIRAQTEIIGVSGLYRQPGMPSNICWLEWFSVRSRFRRRGFGTAAIRSLASHARTIACKELWVYTHSSDDIARSFYMSLGFEALGPAYQCARGQTMDDSDIVMKRML